MTQKPKAAGPGAHIRVVAPASNAKQSRIEQGAAALRSLGYKVTFATHAEGRERPYFSATPAQRLEDLHNAFADPEVNIIMATRGGYGSNYLLEALDLDLIANNPKPFFAYSDMTTLATYLADKTGLVAFHGPMLAADFYLEDGVDLPSFTRALSGELLEYGPSQGLRTLQQGAGQGTAEGTLYGGCLTLLTASLGTPYTPQLENKLLFIEDVGTKPYQIDRMLRHLKLAGKLQGVQGIIFGEMLDCISPGADPALIDEAILTALNGFEGPIATGLCSGHVSRSNVTLPLNIQARLTTTGTPKLTTLEPAVVIE